MKSKLAVGISLAVLTAPAFAVKGTHTGVIGIYSGPAANETCALLADARILCWGRIADTYNSGVPLPVNIGHDVMEISLGQAFGCARVSDGRVFCWGDNGSGQLGTTGAHDTPEPVQYVGTDFGNVTAIAAGQEHVCVLRNGLETSAWCWGNNQFGQLGNFNVGIGTSSFNEPIQVVVHDPTHTPPNPPLSNLTQISSGALHSCALLSDNTGACWGYDEDGELANGASKANYDSPQTVYVDGPSGYSALVMGGGLIAGAGYHTCGLATGAVTNVVDCWGLNDYGELGIGNKTTELSAHLAMDESGPITNAIAAAGGEYFTCAILVDLTVRCWGSNAHYQIANPSVPIGATQLTGIAVIKAHGIELGGVTQLVAGQRHVCVLDTAGDIYCWGDNSYNQVDGGTETQTNVPRKLSIDSTLFTDNFDGN